MYSPWNPLEKGAYSTTYSIESKPNGELTFNNLGIWDSYSTILQTDYSSYIVQYKCKQAYFDFYTEEYIDIFTPDGTITEGLLTELKAMIKEKMPNFDIDGLLAPAKAKNCDTVNAWGFI